MSQNLRVALTTSLNDQLVGPLRRALDEIEKNLKKVEQGLGGVTQKSQQASQAMTGLQGPDRAAKQVAELARNTQNAVTLADRLKTAWSAAGNMMRGVTTGIAAFQAAKYVVAAPLQQARSYDRQLRDLGNTAYGELSGEKFTAKIKDLDALLMKSLQVGGGTREGAVGAAGTLMAQGGLTEAQLAKVMPTIMKAATAANAAPNDIANVVAAALKNGFNVDQISTMIGKAIASGQAGGFEMKDMAKWLPKLLAAGSSIGMVGMKDFQEILALAQVSRTTAGGSDEAGNNLVNFLLKVNSNDTQMDAQKQKVDLSGTLAKNRDAGMSGASSFLALLQREMDKDPRIVKLRSMYAAAGNDGERVASLKAQEQIFGGSAMGKFLQDRQALMPAIGALNNPAERKKQLDAAEAGGEHTMVRAFGNIADGADFIAQQKNNEELFAQTRGLKGVNDAMAKLDAGVTSLYRNNESLAAGFEVAKVAVYGLAMAAGAAGLAQLAVGGGGLVAMLKRLLGIAPVAVPVAAALPGVAAPAVATAGGVAGAGVLAGGAVLAGAGLLAGGAVLGAGYLMSESMNSESGLRSRIDSRQARLNELTELAGLTRDGGGSAASMQRIYGEIDKVKSDRDNLAAKLASTETQVAAERNALAAQAQALTAVAQRPIRVVLDGREIAAAANSYNEFFTRRN